MNSIEAVSELLELFLVVAKQDKWNHTIDKPYLRFFFRHYNNDEILKHLDQQYDLLLKNISGRKSQSQHQLTTDIDSVKTLAITKRLNRLITDEERLIILALLCEQGKTGDFISTQRNEIIEAINSVFALDKNVFASVKNFVLAENEYTDADENTLILESKELSLYNRIRGVKHQFIPGIDISVAVKKPAGFPDLLLIKYYGESRLKVNGKEIEPRRFYTLRTGETLADTAFSFTFEKLIEILNKKFTLDSLYIEKTEKMPLVDFNVTTNVLRIAGVSIPEDALAFYKPLLHWLGLYLQQKPVKSELIFELEFFNTVSSRLFLEIMKMMQKLKESGTDVTIRWLYAEDDEDIQEAGENYGDMVAVNFVVEPK